MNRVILHLTSGDEQTQKRLFTQINNIKRALPECEIEVVAHGEAVKMFLNQSTTFAGEIQEQIQKKIVVTVCRNSLTPIGAGEEDLIKGVKVVNSALAHIIMHPQRNGSYIKIGN